MKTSIKWTLSKLTFRRIWKNKHDILSKTRIKWTLLNQTLRETFCAKSMLDIIMHDMYLVRLNVLTYFFALPFNLDLLINHEFF